LPLCRHLDHDPLRTICGFKFGSRDEFFSDGRADEATAKLEVLSSVAGENFFSLLGTFYGHALRGEAELVR
jgi:hypothetical protein